jgi:hypothetical protein
MSSIPEMVDPPPYEKEPVYIHKQTNHYTIQYPEHELRKQTSIYRHTHESMKHMPCFICNKTNKKDNIPIETHHFYVEKAAQNAIDWIKFGEFAKHATNLQTGESLNHFNWNEVQQNSDLFVDSPYNMIVLCKEHHTSGNKGIHHVPFPDWILDKFAKQGYSFLV